MVPTAHVAAAIQAPSQGGKNCKYSASLEHICPDLQLIPNTEATRLRCLAKRTDSRAVVDCHRLWAREETCRRVSEAQSLGQAGRDRGRHLDYLEACVSRVECPPSGVTWQNREQGLASGCPRAMKGLASASRNWTSLARGAFETPVSIRLVGGQCYATVFALDSSAKRGGDPRAQTAGWGAERPPS